MIVEFTEEHCNPKIPSEDYTDKVVAVQINSLVKEYQKMEYQLQYVTSHETPKIFGDMVCCIALFSGDESYFETKDILGEVKIEFFPDWAKENLEDIDSFF